MSNMIVVVALIVIFPPTYWLTRELHIFRYSERGREKWGWQALSILFLYLLAAVILFLFTDNRGWFFLPLLLALASALCGFKSDLYYLEQVQNRENKKNSKKI